MFFEDVELNQEFISPGRTVTEADVVAFAGVSGDFNQIHTDAEVGRKSIFGERIAHGLLGLSIASGLKTRLGLFDDTIVAFLALKDWEFRRPILMGDTVRVRVTISDKRETRHPDRGIVAQEVQLLNQRDEVVQEGIHLLMVKRKPIK